MDLFRLGRQLGIEEKGLDRSLLFSSMHSPFPSRLSATILVLLGCIALTWFQWHRHASAAAETVPAIVAELETVPDKDAPTFRYTPPVKLARLVNEWEPQQALVIGMSLPEVMAAADIAQYQLKLLEVAHPYVEIYVLCEDDFSRAYAYFLSLINRHPNAEAILDRTRFVDSRNLIRWTRDYGPIFGIKPDKGLVAIDFIYRNLTRDLEELTHDKPETLRRFMTLQGDAMPGDLAVYLQQRFDTDVEIVRPPLSMDGGDFVHDGEGNIFVSTQTLIRNGGNKPALAELFRRYFGAKELHVLQSLPGSTVNHLDMIVKFVDPKTVILPDYQTDGSETLNRYRSELSKKVQSILLENENYIRKHLPEVRIIKMPMPPIMFKSPDEILVEARSEFLRFMAVSRGIMPAEQINQLKEPGLTQLEEKTQALIQNEVGTVNWSSIDGFNAILRHYGQLPMDKYFDVHSESVTRYRSYINSVFLHNTDGRQAFIVPQFSPQNPDERARVAAWESQVDRIYRQVRPQAQVHWVNCDAMVTDMGFIHCTTITVPAWRD